jgi:hypothetical protein
VLVLDFNQGVIMKFEQFDEDLMKVTSWAASSLELARVYE